MLKVNVDGEEKYYRLISHIQRYGMKNYRMTSLGAILAELASMPGYLPRMNVRRWAFDKNGRELIPCSNK